MSIINITPLKWTIKLLYHPQNPNQTNPCSYDWLALKAQTNKLDQTGRKTSRIMNAVVGTTIYCRLRWLDTKWQGIHVQSDRLPQVIIIDRVIYDVDAPAKSLQSYIFYLVMRHMLHIALSLFRIWFFINQYVLLL